MCILSEENLARLYGGIDGFNARDAINMSKLCSDAWVLCRSRKYDVQSSLCMSSSSFASRHINSCIGYATVAPKCRFRSDHCLCCSSGCIYTYISLILQSFTTLT